MNVLLLDDDSDFLASMADVLRMLNVDDCRVAHSVSELQKMGAAAVDVRLAILDVNLGPGAPSGIDGYAWLRGHGYAGEVAFLTGHAEHHPLVAKVLHLPNTRVLAKPISLEQIEDLLKGSA